MLIIFYMPLIVSGILQYAGYQLLTRYCNLNKDTVFNSMALLNYLILSNAMLALVCINLSNNIFFAHPSELIIVTVLLGYYLSVIAIILQENKKFNLTVIHHILFFILCFLVGFDGFDSKVYYLFLMLFIQQVTAIPYHSLLLVPDRFIKLRLTLYFFDQLLFFLIRIVFTLAITLYFIHAYFFDSVTIFSRLQQFIIPILLLINNGMNIIWFAKKINGFKKVLKAKRVPAWSDRK